MAPIRVPAPSIILYIYDGHKEKKPSDCAVRPYTYIATRYRVMLTKCTRFRVCYASAKVLKRSGTNETDEIRLTTDFFNNKKVEHPNKDVGPNFKFMSSWIVLRDLPKFQEGSESGYMRTPVSGDGGDGEASRDVSVGDENIRSSSDARGGAEKNRKRPERPPGRHRAKELLSLEDHRTKKLRMANDTLSLQKRHVLALERNIDIQLFANGHGRAESEMAQEFFKLQNEERLLALNESLVVSWGIFFGTA